MGRAGGGYVAPDPAADAHESLTPPWWPAEFVFKRHYDYDKKAESHRMNLFRRRTIPPGSSIHESAYARGDAYQARLPPDAKRMN